MNIVKNVKCYANIYLNLLTIYFLFFIAVFLTVIVSAILIRVEFFWYTIDDFKKLAGALTDTTPALLIGAYFCLLVAAGIWIPIIRRLRDKFLSILQEAVAAVMGGALGLTVGGLVFEAGLSPVIVILIYTALYVALDFFYREIIAPEWNKNIMSNFKMKIFGTSIMLFAYMLFMIYFIPK